MEVKVKAKYNCKTVTIIANEDSMYCLLAQGQFWQARSWGLRLLVFNKFWHSSWMKKYIYFLCNQLKAKKLAINMFAHCWSFSIRRTRTAEAPFRSRMVQERSKHGKHGLLSSGPSYWPCSSGTRPMSQFRNLPILSHLPMFHMWATPYMVIIELA